MNEHSSPEQSQLSGGDPDGDIQASLHAMTELSRELQAKLDHLQDSKDDLENFIISSGVATLFLDAQLRLRRFTPAFGKAFDLVEANLGRPLTDFWLAGEDAELLRDTQSILDGSPPIERQVHFTRNHCIYQRRLTPYRASDGAIRGVVVTMVELTELLATQERAEKQLALNQCIYDSAPVGLAFVDADLRFQSINHRLAEIDGSSVAAHLGKRIDEILPPALSQPILKTWQQVLDDGQPVCDLELTGRPHGSTEDRHFLASYVPLEDRDGQSMGINIVVQEITELKRAQRQLESREREIRDTNQRLEIAQKAGQVGSWEWDIDADRIIWNQSFLEVFGFTAENVPPSAEAFWEFVHPDDLEQTQECVRRVISGETPDYNATFRIRTPDKGYLWLNARGLPKHDANGRITQLNGAAINVTEQKRWEAEQEGRQIFLRSILDHQLACVSLLDTDGNAIAVNRGMLEANGCSYDELIGNPIWEHPLWNHCADSRELLEQSCQQARNGQPLHRDTTVQLPNGTLAEFDFMLAPVFDDHGTLTHLLASAVNIDARKSVERELRRSEERYRALVEATAECVWTTNAVGAAEEDSQSWRNFTGQSFEQYRGWGWLDAIHPEDQPHARKAWDNAVASQSQFNAEYRVRRANGQYRWVSARGVPVFDEDERVSQWVGLNVDIQKYKDLTQIAERNEYRLAAALDAANAGSWEATMHSLDLDGSVYARELHSLLPATPLTIDDALAKIDERDRPAVEKAAHASLSTGVPFSQEYRARGADGKLRWILSQAKVEPNSTPPRLLGFAQDITHRKEATLALASSERRLAAALEGGKMGLWEWDVEREEVFWNRREYELLGLEPGSGPEPISRFFDRVHPDDMQDFNRVLKRVINGEHDLQHELRIYRTDGELRWLATIGRAELDDNGKAVRIVGVNYDITEQKLLDQELRESDQRKDQFLALLAHELRNPLTPLRSGLEILRASTTDAPHVTHTINTMDHQLQHMVALIEDLLDISRITHGKLRLRTETFSCQSVIHDAIEMCRPLIDQAHHQLSLEQPLNNLNLHGDSHRLTQVIANLLSNAAKYTPDHGHIQISLTATASRAVIEVRDNGIGIPADQLDSVFGLFHQVDRDSRDSQSGLGIGLALSKHLIELHHGGIKVSSDGEHQGTTFTIWLPLPQTPDASNDTGDQKATPENELTTPTDTQPTDSQNTGQHSQPLKILVADDNVAAADSLSLLLKVWGYQVFTATNGQDAIEQAHRLAPDLILMDIGMPVVDGYAAARAIRQTPRGAQVKLVAISGWGTPKDIQKSLDAGFDSHLVKPLAPNALQELLMSLAPTN